MAVKGRGRGALCATVTAVALLALATNASARPVAGPTSARPGHGARSGGEVFGSSAPLAPGAIRPGFQDRVVASGLTYPTVMQFSPDGRVFIGEKGGVVKVFDGFGDPTPDVFADLSTNVYDYWDRGLLGLALPPTFPADPYVYVLYTLDAPVGQSPPVYNDDCPSPTVGGCVAGARLSRLQTDGNHMTGAEEILIEDWCQQFPSHSIGTLAFGPDGALYVGGGDGASFEFVDYGQDGNPCRDPKGRNPTPPTAQGGALRAQDIRTAHPLDPTTMDGSILRVDPATGQALPDNPLYGGSVTDDDRIIAHGTRNPFRFTVKPGTDEIVIGDVGWSTWEEIDILADANDGVVENFGWPCYEGEPIQSNYDVTDLDVCEDLYGEPGAVTPPLYEYNHGEHPVANDNCSLSGGSVISGITFHPPGGNYPPQFDGALFFADHSRNCIWTMFADEFGDPDPSTLARFENNAGHPVDLKAGTGGSVYYVDFDGGQIHQIRARPA
jgi:glucose/arabinose dehydrogenase